MKTYSLDQVQDKLIGKVGTANRDKFEYELQMDLIGKASFDDIKKCLSKFCLEIDMRHLFNN